MEELEDIYARPTTGIRVVTIIDNSTSNPVIESTVKEVARFLDRIKEALFQSLQHHTNLVIMDQDIAECGGAL